MFQKVFIVEDMDDINKGVFTTLKDMNIAQVQSEQYCDDAYIKLKKAAQEDEPYELLITDLSFKADYRAQKYDSGESLIKKIREDFSNLKIIVYSVEDRLQRVRRLVTSYGVNAYVCKGRNGLQELTQAINDVYNNELYLSPHISHALAPKVDLEITDYDILLLEQLSKGLSQPEISDLFKKERIKPFSLSSVEKHLNKLKERFNANSTLHLIVIVKDMGLI